MAAGSWQPSSHHWRVTSRSSAEASREDEVVLAALDALPDVALLDIEMPGGDGRGDGVWDKLPSCRVIVLTTSGRAGYLKRALQSGAGGVH